MKDRGRGLGTTRAQSGASEVGMYGPLVSALFLNESAARRRIARGALMAHILADDRTGAAYITWGERTGLTSLAVRFRECVKQHLSSREHIDCPSIEESYAAFDRACHDTARIYSGHQVIESLV